MFASIVTSGAVLQLQGENSKLEFGSGSTKAVFYGRCGDSSPALTHITPGKGECHSLRNLKAYPTDLVMRAHTRNVAMSCFGEPYETPCASLPIDPCREPRFVCSWTTTGAGGKVTVEGTPQAATLMAHKLDGAVVAHDVYVDCAFPAFEDVYTSWMSTLGPSQRAANLNVSLQLNHGDTALLWQGAPLGNTFQIPFALLDPPSPPPPPTQPPPPPPPAFGSGGDRTISADGWVTHVFKSTGTFSIDSDVTLAYVLIVAGGGGCGYSTYHNGGGGAGGLVYATNFDISAGTSTVTVGAGGAGSGNYNGRGQSGGHSIAFGLTASGGGAGGHYPDVHSGVIGGSGGGGGSYGPGAGSNQNKYSSLSNVQGFGNSGGNGKTV
jgi:hypothetical protein